MLTAIYLRFGRRIYDGVFTLNTRLMQFERYLGRWVATLEGDGPW